MEKVKDLIKERGLENIEDKRKREIDFFLSVLDRDMLQERVNNSYASCIRVYDEKLLLIILQ